MARVPLLGCLLVAALASASAMLALALDDPAADGSVAYWDFESESDLEGWRWDGGELTLAPGLGVNGTTAGAVTVVGIGQRAIARLLHPIEIIPGGSYELSGEFVSSEPPVDWGRLTLALYEADQSRVDLPSVDQLYAPGSWFARILVPCRAARGEVEVLVRGAPGSILYLDDLRLKGSPPATPCSTPTPSPTPSATMSPTLSPTPSPTVLASPTPSSTVPPSPTPTTASLSPTPTASLTPTPTPTLSPTAPSPTPSHGLLVNGGFEAEEEGSPVRWRKYGGVLTRVAEPVRSGRFAAGFFSSSSSTKWVYQTVGVSPTAWYELEAYVYQDDPWVQGALLRISWYVSGDGSGSAVASVDSLSQLEEPEGRYRRLSTGPVRAPPGVHSAKVRIVLRPRSGVSALIYIDDASFWPAAAPPTPTPSPSPQPAPSLTPTPSPSPQPTASPTPAPSPAPQSTALPTPTVGPSPQPTALVTATPRPGPTATVTPTLSPQPTQSSTPASQPQATPAPGPTEPAASPTPSHGLLVNGGFEVVEEGSLVGWQKYGGVLTRVPEPVRSGQFAAGFFSSSSSTKWVYQTVGVSPTAWYELEAYVYQDDPWVQGALLRISWYVSADGSGSAVASVDSLSQLEEPEGRYRRLSTGPVRAPPGVHSAKARIVLRPRSGVSALIYIDDVSFRSAVAPPVPLEPAVQERAGEEIGGATGTRRASGDQTISEVLEVSQSESAEAFRFTPQPTPVIRRSRNGLLVPVDTSSSTEGAPWWPWALAGGAAVLGVAGWGAYWRGRRR